MEGSDFEPLLNKRLGDLLRDCGLTVEVEQRQRGSSKQIDIEVRERGLVVALEGESTRQRALQDAQKRLDESARREVVAQEAVGVVYPQGLRADDFDMSTKIEWAVLPDRDFSAGNPPALAATVRRIAASRGDPDRVAKRLGDALMVAVGWLDAQPRKRLATAMGLATTQKVKGKSIDRTDAAAVRALLVLVAAAMFHARLDDELPASAPQHDARKPPGTPYTGPWPPKRLQDCRREERVVDALHDAWQAILALDYRPVFEAGCNALTTPTDDEKWRNCLKNVLAAAQDASASAASAGHDLLGKIFHRLLDTARYDGSFYTSASAAVLLAGLALQPDTQNADAEPDQFRMIDPACGTGTLLMAAVERLRDLHPERTDSAALIEKVAWGLDINTTACHMAATTLGLLSPSTTFRNMNIYQAQFGKVGTVVGVKGKVSLPDVRAGSLELLQDPAAASAEQRFEGLVWSPAHHVDDDTPSGIPPNSFDLVIMNPPFTRDSLRHDHLDPEVEKALKAREKKLMAGRHGHGSSSGTMFLDLGEHLTSLADGSTLAFVFPAAGVAAPSAHAVRELLGQWFHIEWVVDSQDPQRINFSENTSISEMLVVARRHTPESDEQTPDTKFVRLLKNPATAAEAVPMVDAILSDSLPPRRAIVVSWPADSMAKGRWPPLTLFSQHLADLYDRIIDGDLFPVNPLGEIADVGPAGRRIRDAFTKQSTADSEARRAVWHNDTRTHRSLLTAPDSYIHAKPAQQQPKNPAMADRYWKQRACLFLAVSPRLITLRAGAVCTQEAALGSHWIPVRPNRTTPAEEGLSNTEKALAVWFNSTLGLVSIIGTATPKTLSRPNLSLDAMKRIPCPILDNDATDTLASVFNQRGGGGDLQRLEDVVTDPARIELDRAISDTLGVPAETLPTARQELASEPSVLRLTQTAAVQVNWGISDAGLAASCSDCGTTHMISSQAEAKAWAEQHRRSQHPTAQRVTVVRIID